MIRAAQLRMARAALGWSLKDLAHRAGVHMNTVARCEAGHDALTATVQKMEDVFRDEGIVFVEDSAGFGVTVLVKVPKDRPFIKIGKTKPKKQIKTKT